MWDLGLRHGPATYFHPNGNKEEATYVEGYEEGESTVFYASGKVEKRNYAKVASEKIKISDSIIKSKSESKPQKTS